jgi:hypothetical protein
LNSLVPLSGYPAAGCSIAPERRPQLVWRTALNATGSKEKTASPLLAHGARRNEVSEAAVIGAGRGTHANGLNLVMLRTRRNTGRYERLMNNRSVFPNGNRQRTLRDLRNFSQFVFFLQQLCAKLCNRVARMSRRRLLTCNPFAVVHAVCSTSFGRGKNNHGWECRLLRRTGIFYHSRFLRERRSRKRSGLLFQPSRERTRSSIQRRHVDRGFDGGDRCCSQARRRDLERNRYACSDLGTELRSLGDLARLEMADELRWRDAGDLLDRCPVTLVREMAPALPPRNGHGVNAELGASLRLGKLLFFAPSFQRMRHALL